MHRNSNPGFIAIPNESRLTLAWPTDNHNLFTRPALFFARTRANPDYGKPGWTRECGKKFHRGLDIAPVNPVATGKTTRVLFTNCASGEEYESVEPTWAVDEQVMAVADGVIAEINHDESTSTLGRYMLIKHLWPSSRQPFFSLYAHLASIAIEPDAPVRAGQRISAMGQTSSSPDARNWMSIAPHLHLEFHDANGNAYDPLEMLLKFLPR
jgi:murein DD-endopeptidase MepM/ murein hydrolase activator NlpD